MTSAGAAASRARGRDRPLAGKTVVVTRPAEQAASLAEPLAALGADVVLAPTIRIVPRALDDEVVRVILNELPAYHVILFTSANSVDVFLGYFAELGLPASELAGARVAAIGPATKAALEAGGAVCDLMAEDFVAEGLLAALEQRGFAPAGARVLLPRAREARDVLPDTLRARGARVDILVVYDVVAAARLAVPVGRIETASYITFTSGSTARQFAVLMRNEDSGRSLAERLAGVRLCSIGPATSDVLRELGLPVAIEAAEHTAAGLATAIAASAGGAG
jgi:uroporphyrinogen III methyltransferase / synthase